MRIAVVSVQFVSGHGTIRVRELTGHDERTVSGTSTVHALELINALLVVERGEALHLNADDLVAADRDRILAAIHQQAFGDRLESTLTCESCRNPFDLHFSLGELVASVGKRAKENQPEFVALGENCFQARAGWRFRLPSGRDEREIALMPTERAESVLLERCFDSTGPRPDPLLLQSALETVAPLIDLNLKARCPECDRVQFLRFDIQSYLLGSILSEQTRLLSEVHRIASAYGWSLHEILSLGRTERRQIVALIENEFTRRARARR